MSSSVFLVPHLGLQPELIVCWTSEPHPVVHRKLCEVTSMSSIRDSFLIVASAEALTYLGT